MSRHPRKPLAAYHDPIRDAIIKAMREEGLTANAVAVRVSGKRKAPSWITGYLRGENGLTTRHVEPLLKHFGLVVVRERHVKLAPFEFPHDGE